MRTLILIAALLVSAPAFAQTYNYTARTQNSVLQAGEVRAGSLTWNCSGNACRISGPWAAPGLGACAQLAAIVGRVTEYGHPGARLTSAQLASCNESAAAPQVQAMTQVQQTLQMPNPQTPVQQPVEINPDVIQPRQTVTAVTTIQYTAPRITRQTIHVEPRPTSRLWAIRVGGGDGDFGGNGPRVQLSAEISADGPCLLAQIDMIAEETRPDNTRGRVSERLRLWCNPDGGNIERIVTPTRATANYTDTDWEIDTIVPGRGEIDVRRGLPETDGPVRSFIVLGDTNGDIATNSNDGRDVGDLDADGNRTVERTSVQVQWNSIDVIVPWAAPVAPSGPAGTQTITLNGQHTDFHIPPHTGGDRDFNGRGPRVIATSQLDISSDRRRIVAAISATAEEMGGTTRAAGDWSDETIWEAPAGWQIDAVNVHYSWWNGAEWLSADDNALGRQSRFHYIDSDHEQDFLIEGDGEAGRNEDNSIYFDARAVAARIDSVSPVAAMRIVGDTNGSEAGTRTGVQAFYRPLIVTLSPTSPSARVSDLEPDVFLDVPSGDYGNRLSGGNSCGPQAGSRVLRFYGVPTTYEQFKRRVQSSGNLVSDQSLGTPPGTLRDRMNDLSSGFVHDVLPLGNSRNNDRALETIRNHLDQGRPVMTLISWGSQLAYDIYSPHDAASVSHWVVVRGYDARAQTFLVIDNGHEVEWSYTLFESLFDYGQDLQYEAVLAAANVQKGSIIYRR